MGGGLYASTGTIDLKNTTIRTNTAIENGPGGGIDPAASTLTIRDSQVYSNSAYNGGGVALEGMLNTRIERSEFYSNTAAGTGGGIANGPTFDNPINPLTLVDSNLHDNFSSFSGGAISTNSTLALSRTVLNANHAVYKGGGIYTNPGSAAIDNGDNAACAAAPISNLDQRGVLRPLDGNGDGIAICDIGAVERRPSDSDLVPWLYLPLILR